MASHNATTPTTPTTMRGNNVAKGTELAVFKALQPGNARLQALIEENLGGDTLSPSDLTRIKMPTSGSTTWSIPTARGPVATNDLDVVVLYTRLQRAYWEPTEGKAKSKLPACSSDDTRIGTAERTLDAEGHEIYGDCETCWYAEWGSKIGPNGQPLGGQACKLMRPVYFWTIYSPIPMWIAFPPTSLKAWRQYLLDLVAAELSYTAVVTRLELRATENARGDDYSIVAPHIERDLDQAEADEAATKAAQYRPALSKIRAQQLTTDD